MFHRSTARALVAALAGFVAFGASSTPAWADEADIRRNLPQRVPKLPPIESVSPTPIAGIYEVVIGGEIVYSDAQGNHLIRGEILQTNPMRNLTEERSAKLSGFDFAKLPLKDAVVWKNGNGKRKVAVFADPNCGYCKRFERELQQVKDLTVYTFIIPILGGDSPQKSRDIWCSKNQTQAWLDWMLRNQTPPRQMGSCDTPMERNLQLAQKHRVRGTPGIVFEDGSFVPGMLPAADLEQRLSGGKT